MVPMQLLCVVSEDPPVLHFQEQASTVVHINCSFCILSPWMCDSRGCWGSDQPPPALPAVP